MKGRVLILILLSVFVSKANFNFDAIFYTYSQNQGESWSFPHLLWEGAFASAHFRISYIADSPKVYIPSGGEVIMVWYTYNLQDFQFALVGTVATVVPWWDSIPRLSITSYDMDTVFLVWEDKINDTIYSIKFSCSFDSCNTWFPQAIIFDSLKNSPQSVIKYYPPFIHLIWRNKNKIYYSRSNTYGLTWTAPYIISKDTVSFKKYPVMDVKGNFIVVAWQDFRNGKSDIYYNFSTDTGNTWFEMDIPICDDPEGSFYPDIEIDSPYVYTSWTFFSNLYKMGFAKSLDSGITWIKSFIDLDYESKMFTSITSKGETIYATWSPPFASTVEQNISKFFYSFNAGNEWDEGSPPPKGACMEIHLDKSNILHLCYHIYVVNIREKYYKTFILNKKSFLHFLKNFHHFQIFDIDGRKNVNLKGIKFIRKDEKYIKIIIF